MVNITANKRPSLSDNSGNLPIIGWATADIHRFWSYVRIAGPDDCWLWQGPVIGTSGYKYGQFSVTLNGRRHRLYAHRIACESAHGALATGHVACHACDVTRCCNPRHLFPGFQSDNLKDAAHKGRFHVPRPNAQRVSAADLVEIDRLLAAGVKRTRIAEAFGVSKSWVSQYANGARRQYDRPAVHLQKGAA